ncbi:N-acetyltransferase family protein [Mailhella sp.]|uniref:N-acetyltransferase family protein n=1 Tax=Mailhella sp. TaxID=1981029 RepID=UPI004062B354
MPDMPNALIRSACEGDISAMLAIYAPYVEHTAVSFEYAVPSKEEFLERLRRVQSFYPWLVAEHKGRVLGYAYASRFHPRAAYDWCAEVSIYLDRDERGRGLGRKLYERLGHGLRAQGVLTAYSCIAHTQEPDEYLDHASIRFHERMGYRLTGTFPSCGYKFGRWYGMIWMEKRLAPEGVPPVPVVPFNREA